MLMTADRAFRPGWLIALPLLLLISVSSCAYKKDVANTQTELASVKGNLQGLESDLAKRQMAQSEEILELKRTVGVLKDRDDEFRQGLVRVEQKLNVVRIETDENLRHLTDLNREYRKTQEANLQTLAQGLNTKLKEHEVALSDVHRQIEELHSLETDQNRRLGDIASRLNVFLEEATAESGRQAKGLADLTQSYNQLADKMNVLNKELVNLKESVKAATTARGRSHTVAEGETISSIAAKYGVAVDELIRINGITNPNSVKAGQKLILEAP